MSAVPESFLFVAPPAPALDGEAFRGAQTETLILARCAAQIAAEAGPEATLVEFGGGSSRNAALLKAAIEALPRSPLRGAAGRRLVFVPGARTGALPADKLAALLRRIRDMSGDDALLVVGAATPREPAARGAASIDCESPCGYSLPCFERLAHAAGWEHCQFWTDGQSRFAIHVLERAKN